MDFYPSIEIILLDIINIIINMTITSDKLYFMATNKYLLNNIKIESIKINKHKSQNSIQQDKFKNIKKLTIRSTNNLNISFLTNLTHLKLISSNIKGVSHLTNLICLKVSFTSLIKQDDIIPLKLLAHLDIDFNNKIYSITHLTKILYLSASGLYNKINQHNILLLTNLTYLNIGCNTKITDISHLSYLTNLRAMFYNIDISKSYQLRTITYMSRYEPIVSHLTNLTCIKQDIMCI